MIEFFAKHRVAANVLMLLMLLFGIFGISRLNSQFLPHFDLNFITVSVVWPSANATDVEQAILIPIERELRNLTSLKKLKGLAKNGMATIVLEFEENADMSLALEKTKSRVARVGNLPANAEPAQIARIERFEPVASVLVYGSVNFNALKARAYAYESDLLQRGINKITMTGIPDEHISIQIPTTSLLSLNLSLHEVAQLIRAKNPEMPIGDIGNSTDTQELRVPRGADTIEEYMNMVIRTSAHGEQVRLGDIARISQIPKDNSVQLFYEGKPAIELLLQRSDTGSAFKAARHLQEWASENQNELDDIQFRIFDERWLLIKGRLMLLVKNGGTGLLCILFILFIFLNTRVAFWTALAIPISILTTLGIIYTIGGSIDMVTMFALIMTLGIIVDDTLVVSENALVQFRSGKSALPAVVDAANLMMRPIAASSLTTISAFLPLLMVSGIIGQILSVIPITVTCVILASLVECFLVLPSHLKHSLANTSLIPTSNWRPKFELGFINVRQKIIERAIIPCIKNPFLPIVSGLCLFAFSLSLVITNHVAFTFFPTPDGNIIKLNASFRSGTNQETVYNFLRESEMILKTFDSEYHNKNEHHFLKMVTLVTGSTADTQGDFSNNAGESYGHLSVELYGADMRDITNKAVIEEWKKRIPAHTLIESMEVTTPRGGPPGRDIAIQLSGNQIGTLKKASLELKDHLASITGVSNISDNLPFGKEQLQLKAKPQMHALGLSLDNVTQQLQAGFSDYIIQHIPRGREEIDVTISLQQHEHANHDILHYFPIKTAKNTMVPLSNIVEVSSSSGFDEIRHVRGEPSIKVTAEVDANENNSNLILTNLTKSFIPDLKQRYQIDVRFSGRAEEQRETLHDMLFGAILGVVLIYLVLVLVFSSYTWPLTILFLLPISISGALIGHWVMGYDLTILSLFGIFGLCGIVANDAIILLTFYLECTKTKSDHNEAVLYSIAQRFRPVFLTSITTIAGLSPLLFERSLHAQFLIPMAIAITFGMAFSLPLVLMLLPGLVNAHEKLVALLSRKSEPDQQAS